MGGEVKRWPSRTSHAAIVRLEPLRAPAKALGRRPYHGAAAALASGLALATAPGGVTAVVASLAACVAAACARAAARQAPAAALLIATTVLLGAWVGAARVHAIDASAARPGPAGTTFDGAAVLLEHPRRSLFGSSAMVQVEAGPAAGARVLGRLDGRRPWPDGGQPGVVVRVRGVLESPSSNGSFDWRAYLRRRGVAFELAIDDVAPTGRRRGGLNGVVDALRRRAERALGIGVSPSQAAIARGMVLGEDEAIDPLERDDFRRSGLSHVLAVSGQNVMLLCALALPLLGLLGASPRMRVVVLLGLIAVYVPLAGAGPSLAAPASATAPAGGRGF